MGQFCRALISCGQTFLSSSEGNREARWRILSRRLTWFNHYELSCLFSYPSGPIFLPAYLILHSSCSSIHPSSHLSSIPTHLPKYLSTHHLPIYSCSPPPTCSPVFSAVCYSFVCEVIHLSIHFPSIYLSTHVPISPSSHSPIYPSIQPAIEPA